MKNIDDLIEYIETFQNEKDWSNDIWSIKCMAIVVKQNQLEQVSKLPIHGVSSCSFDLEKDLFALCKRYSKVGCNKEYIVKKLKWVLGSHEDS